MTILCPEQFSEAVQFAVQVDDALEAAMATTHDPAERRELEKKRGRGVKTLLTCFGYRANADVQGNANPFLPPESEVHFAGGLVRKILELDKTRRPVQETFVWPDMAPHSFFFREDWINPDGRDHVDIFDRCWYLFRPPHFTQEEVDAIPEQDLDGLVCGVSYTFNEKTVEDARAAGAICRESKKRRVGLCGGIIYHAEYKDGERLPYGYWSTHT